MPAERNASTISGQISWWRRTYSSSYPGLTSRTHAHDPTGYGTFEETSAGQNPAKPRYSLGRSCGSTLRPCARGDLLPPGVPEQQRRSDEQRDEEPVYGQNLCRRAPRGAQPEDQRDHGDHRLGERHREQRACHSMWPEARDDGADDPDGEHPDIHRVGEVVLRPDDPNGDVYPDEDECRRERNADCGPVRDFARLPRYQHIRETGAEDEGAGEDEVGQAPGRCG